MVPHPLIHLKLAHIRQDQLRAPERRRSAEASARRACALFVGRLVRREREPTTIETHFAHREADGIAVDLYWTHGEHGDAFRVDVVDRRSAAAFSLHPATGKEAVAAYHHPFASQLERRI